MQGVDLIVGLDHAFGERGVVMFERAQAVFDHLSRNRSHPLDFGIDAERDTTGATTRACADIDRLVADTFEVGGNLEARQNHPQVDRGGLIEGEDLHATLIDFAVETVDLGVTRGDRSGPIGVAREQAFDGVVDLMAHQLTHAQERFPQLRELLLVAAVGMLQKCSVHRFLVLHGARVRAANGRRARRESPLDDRMIDV